MKSAPASPVKVAQVKSAEEEKEVIPTKSKSGPTSKKTYKRTHEEEQDGEGDEVEVTTAIKPQSKAGASYKPKPGPSLHHLLLVVRSVHAVPVHFLLVVMEKCALACISVVLVMPLVQVVVCVVLGLLVEHCEGVAV